MAPKSNAQLKAELDTLQAVYAELLEQYSTVKAELELLTSQNAPESILSDDSTEDELDLTERVNRASEWAKNASVAKFYLPSPDPHGLLSKVKVEFMRACDRMGHFENKRQLMHEFVDVAKEVIDVRFKHKLDLYQEFLERNA